MYPVMRTLLPLRLSSFPDATSSRGDASKNSLKESGTAESGRVLDCGTATFGLTATAPIKVRAAAKFISLNGGTPLGSNDPRLAPRADCLRELSVKNAFRRRFR